MTRNEAPELLEQAGVSDQDEPSPPDRHMAAVILPLASLVATQYKLPEADRLAILAQALAPHQQLSAATTAENERQRREFIAMHGCPFGALSDEDQ